MADATVTIKLSPAEHRTVRNSLTALVRIRKEQLEIEDLNPRARADMKAEVLNVERIIDHI